jgi:hypothetical protein
MIKLVLGVIAVLALLGGAIQFESDEQSWSLVVNKEAALSSVKNGAIKIYDFSRDLMSSNGQTEGIGIITDN